jgi:drug/metabolite transporter (DMT)-like permease
MTTPDSARLLLSTRQINGTGLAIALISAILWGLSALAAQYLFIHAHVQAGWLVSARMAIAGVFILAALWLRRGKQYILEPLRHAQTRIHLVIFASAGLWAVQYAYMAAIEHGNAASATLLQYTAPALITLYTALAVRRFPSFQQNAAIMLSLAGTWLLVSDGQWGIVRLSGQGLFWGLISSVVLAFYSLYPGGLLRRWGATRIVGWGMLLGSLFFQAFFPLWNPGPVLWSWWSIALLLYVVLPGTLIAFWLYLASLQRISPASASLIASAEPLVATVGSVLWLGVSLHQLQEVGALLIIAAVAVLGLALRGSQKIL